MEGGWRAGGVYVEPVEANAAGQGGDDRAGVVVAVQGKIEEVGEGCDDHPG